MKTLEEYFRGRTYKPVYTIGDRVRGVWMGTPFSGTVGVDHKPYADAPAQVAVFLDLPILLDGVIYNMIKVKHGDFNGTGEKYEINSKANSKKSVMDSNRRGKKSRKS